MKALLEAGVHFGHQTRRWHPKMKSYIFTERSGIHIIDLQQTVVKLGEAYAFVRDTVANGGTIMFVGTKKQAQESVAEEATRCGMSYVTQRWLGGMLTNFSTIQARLAHLAELEQRKAKGEFERLPKKEAMKLEEEIARLNRLLGGIKGITRLPDAVYIIDPHRETIAVAEAHKLEIPVVALVDTNCNPDWADYPIPANDDAIRAVKLLTNKIADAVIEGQQLRQAAAEGAVEGEAVPVEAMPAVGEEMVKAEVAEEAPVEGGLEEVEKEWPSR
jgi:small subunit ribosomal protein S2